MDLRAPLLELVAPHGLGAEVLPGVVLERASAELGLRLTFAIAGAGPLHVELSPLADTPRYAARSTRLALSYRARGADPGLGKRLCDTLAAAVRDNEERVLARLEAEAEAQAGARLREVEVDTLLEPMGRVTAARDETFYGLSPYVGCLVGCRFCYAQSHLDPLRRLLGRAAAPWGSWVDARVNAPAVLARELEARPRRPIKLCPIVSDPYQPLEKRLGLTRACLEVLVGAAFDAPVFVLTRAPLVRRDLPLLARLPGAHLGVSLPTADDAVRAHFEPRAASVDERLALLRDARAAGLATFAVVQPMLAGDRAELADALAAHADSVHLAVLQGEYGAAADFDDPRFAATREPAWQKGAAAELAGLLDARGVPRWEGELPPERQP